MFPHPFGNTEPIASQFQIGNDGSEIEAPVVENVDGFVCGDSFDYPITAIAQVLGNRHPNENIILRQKHRPHCLRVARFRHTDQRLTAPGRSLVQFWTC